MTHCHSETLTPDTGFAWKEPAALDLRVETERVIVRPYVLDDAQPVFEAVNLSRDSLLPWMPWARTDHHELASTVHYVSQQIVRLSKPLTTEGVGVGIFDKASGQFLGGTGFHDLRRDTASVETGYWIRADRRREGLCTEAMARWLSKMLAPQNSGGLGLRRIRIYCSSGNTPSTRVPEKLALRGEVMQRQDYYVPHHGVTDRLGWGVMHDEWDCVRHRVKDSGAERNGPRFGVRSG